MYGDPLVFLSVMATLRYFPKSLTVSYERYFVGWRGHTRFHCRISGNFV